MADVVEQNFVSLGELCEQLSISVATGRNWLKLDKIEPAFISDNVPYFTKEYLSELTQSIAVGDNSSLKSRRNKKYVSGNNLYSSYISKESKNIDVVQQIISSVNDLGIELSENLISTIIVYYARQIMDLKCEFLLQDIINNFGYSDELVKKYSKVFEFSLVKELHEDILGLLYISLKNLGDRKSKGAYYTPTSIVKRLVLTVFEGVDCSCRSVLDPCCGTGNFILQLPTSFSAENVYASDIDLMSVLIARINYANKFGVNDKNLIYKNVYQCDYLNSNLNRKYDYIIGNPPWGVAFSSKEKLRLRKKYLSANGVNVESYDVVVEQALSELNLNGVLAFVLPEAFLNVKAHKQIRQYLMTENSIKSLEYLGDVFDGVQCPSIIIQLVHNCERFSACGMRVVTNDKEFIIATEREVCADYFNFLTSDKEYSLIQKISNCPNKITLKDNADFALGIVTGDNSKYLSNKKIMTNEGVLKGSDITKYRYNTPKNFISFEPEKFQQVAPVEMYRVKEKLFYKFISSKLVFAYDNKQTLSLNSCNILIPKLQGLSIKYVLAILNSSVAQFFFSKQFNSVKVLKSHIEQIPIPLVNEEVQKEIENIVDEILISEEEIYQQLCDNLDRKIAKLYELSDEEFLLIRT